MRAVIRIVVPEMQPEKSTELLKKIKELVKDIPEATVDLSLMETPTPR
uniref:Uncharacterized protein n=1 Tax=viral metagenome TaxID=1070528 RepID=A0A6H1ZZQ0_9ZZZZ